MILRSARATATTLEVPGIVPKLLGDAGRACAAPAPALGDDTDAVLAAMGLGADAIAVLRAKGIVA